MGILMFVFQLSCSVKIEYGFQSSLKFHTVIQSKLIHRGTSKLSFLPLVTIHVFSLNKIEILNGFFFLRDIVLFEIVK